MNILVVDDEPLARQRLIRFLESLNPEFHVEQAANGTEAMDQVEKFQPDLLLLDIRMPGVSGLEVAVFVSQMAEPPAVIFCTAFEDHALDALKAGAVDYLLKPVRLADLDKAIQKARQVNRVQVSRLLDDDPDGRTHLSISSHRGIQLVPLDAILYFKAEQKYVLVVTKDHEYLADQSLKNLEEEFQQQFIRVHRSALVAKKHMLRISKDSSGQAWLWLDGLEEPLMVSRRHLSDVRSWFKGS